MSGRRNRHVGSHHHIVTNVNVSVINQDEIEVGIESVADVDVLAVSHVHGRFYPDGVSAAPQQLFEQVSSLLPFTWSRQIIVIR